MPLSKGPFCGVYFQSSPQHPLLRHIWLLLELVLSYRVPFACGRTPWHPGECVSVRSQDHSENCPACWPSVRSCSARVAVSGAKLTKTVSRHSELQGLVVGIVYFPSPFTFLAYKKSSLCALVASLKTREILERKKGVAAFCTSPRASSWGPWGVDSRVL